MEEESTGQAETLYRSGVFWDMGKRFDQGLDACGVGRMPRTDLLVPSPYTLDFSLI